MSANGSAMPQESSEIQDKGKGKSVEQAPQQPAFEDEEDEEEESGADEAPEDDDDEDMEEIDTTNIIGSRTRNKDINWAEAEEKLKADGEDAEDDEDDDDEDFEDPEGDDEMKD